MARIGGAAGGNLVRAAPVTLRLQLLKFKARVRMPVQRIRFAISGACPNKEAFARPRRWHRSSREFVRRWLSLCGAKNRIVVVKQ